MGADGVSGQRIELPVAGEALVVDHRRARSAAEVWDVADRLAHLIRDATGGGERRVAVFAENAAESVIAHLGGLRSGASVVPVSSHLAAPEVAYLLGVADVALVVAGPETVERARAAAALVPAATRADPAGARHGATDVAGGDSTEADSAGAGDGATGSAEADASDGAEAEAALPTDAWARPAPHVVAWSDGGWDAWLATAPSGPPPDDRPIRPNLLFTSGTTGTPKATELPPNVFPRRDSWAGFVDALAANRFVGRGRHLVVAPLHHTGPLNAVRALAAGNPVGVLPRFDAATTVAAIEAWRIGSTTLVPTHLSRLAALPVEVRAAADVSSLELVFQTGASCPVDVKAAMIDWWGPVFLEAYGATEVGVTTSIDSHQWLAHPGSVGRAVAPYETVVVDEDGVEVPPGTEGLLCFRDATGRGIIYHGDPERTAAAHVAPGVFTLGEIGRVDPDGWVTITDRASDMIVTGGVNVYPAEMEQVLVAHPAVADVAGIGIAHPDLGEQLVALVVPVDGAAPPAPEELQAWCEARLSRFKCPRAIRLVATLDRNPLGKLDKRALRTTHG